MEKELKAKLNVLDEAKAIIKNHIHDVEISTNRDNYMSMLERKMGMQIILCSLADLQFKLRKEAEDEISGTFGADRQQGESSHISDSDGQEL